GPANVLLEKIPRVVITGDLVDRLANRLSGLEIDRILLLLTAVDNVAQVQDKVGRRLGQLGRRLFPLLNRRRLVLVTEVRVADDGEAHTLSGLARAPQTSRR